MIWKKCLWFTHGFYYIDPTVIAPRHSSFKVNFYLSIWALSVDRNTSTAKSYASFFSITRVGNSLRSTRTQLRKSKQQIADPCLDLVREKENCRLYRFHSWTEGAFYPKHTCICWYGFHCALGYRSNLQSCFPVLSRLHHQFTQRSERSSESYAIRYELCV